MIEVHEVHDWPERTVPGPRIVVWFGRNRRQAERVCDDLSKNAQKCGHKFRYEVVDDDA